MGLLHFVRFHVHPWTNIVYSPYVAFEMSTRHFSSQTEYSATRSGNGPAFQLSQLIAGGTPISVPGHGIFRLAVKVLSTFGT